MSEPIVFKQGDNGDITVDEWPQESSIDTYLLFTIRPAVFKLIEDRLTIAVSNGTAVYRVGEAYATFGRSTIVPLTLIEVRP
jgi:hypothetical protein